MGHCSVLTKGGKGLSLRSGKVGALVKSVERLKPVDLAVAERTIDGSLRNAKNPKGTIGAKFGARGYALLCGQVRSRRAAVRRIASTRFVQTIAPALRITVRAPSSEN